VLELSGIVTGCWLAAEQPADTCGRSARSRGTAGRRDGQQPEGNDVSDLALRQRHLNQLPFRRARTVAAVS
jgi:hypothetical protein